MIFSFPQFVAFNHCLSICDEAPPTTTCPAHRAHIRHVRPTCRLRPTVSSPLDLAQASCSLSISCLMWMACSASWMSKKFSCRGRRGAASVPPRVSHQRGPAGRAETIHSEGRSAGRLPHSEAALCFRADLFRPPGALFFGVLFFLKCKWINNCVHK